MKKWLGLVVAGVLVCLAGLELWRIVQWRAATPELIDRILARSTVSIDGLSPEFIDILLTVEDPSFWSHKGIDFTTPGQGLTTLPQSLGKQLYYPSFKPGIRKLDLMLLTRFALAPTVSHEDILNAVLATAYLGGDGGTTVIGFPAAAERWFGKPFEDLSREEFIGLVAMLVGPEAFNPEKTPEQFNDRVSRIQRLLAGECQPTGLRDVYYTACAALTPR